MSKISDQHQTATNDLDKAIQLGSDYDAIAYNWRGNAYRALGQTSNANADKAKARPGQQVLLAE